MRNPKLELKLVDCPAEKTDPIGRRVRLFASLGKELALLANPKEQCPSDEAFMRASIALSQCLVNAETDPVQHGVCSVASAVAFIAHQFSPASDEQGGAIRAQYLASPVIVPTRGECVTVEIAADSAERVRPDVIPLSSNDRPRHEYDGLVLTGAWSGAKLYWREMSRAVTASPAHWDSERDIFDWVIEVERTVPDSEGIEGQLLITITLPCPMDPCTPAALPYWRALMYRAAMHEVDEALRTSDGVCPHNPHLFNGSQDVPVSFIERIAPAPVARLRLQCPRHQSRKDTGCHDHYTGTD